LRSANPEPISQEASEMFTIDNLTIKNASLEVFIAPTIPSKTQTPVHFGINGVVDFGGLEISSTLCISRSPGETLQWAAYGKYDIATSYKFCILGP
jgi:tRNA(Ile2) C34 agmatinyltransferase TiaS